MQVLICTLVVLLGLSTVFAAKDASQLRGGSTLWSVLSADPELTRFTAAVTAADFDVVLADRRAEELTVVAPSDAAMEALVAPLDFEAFLLNRPAVTRLVLNHILQGAHSAQFLQALPALELPSLLTQQEEAAAPLLFRSREGRLSVSTKPARDAPAATAQLSGERRAVNGVLFVGDAVLVPGDFVKVDHGYGAALAAAAELQDGDKTLWGLIASNRWLKKTTKVLEASQDLSTLLGDASQQLTVLAPTDAAWNVLMTSKQFATLLALPANARRFGANHIVRGAYTFEMLLNNAKLNKKGLPVAPLLKESEDAASPLLFEAEGFVKPTLAVSVNGQTAHFYGSEVRAKNGFLLQIDVVLAPAEPKKVNTPNDHFQAPHTPMLGAPRTLWGLVNQQEDLSMFVRALENTDFGAMVGSSKNTFTLLAPTDAAWSALFERLEDFDSLLATAHRLERMVTNHMINGALTVKELQAMKSVDSVLNFYEDNAEPLALRVVDGALQVANSGRSALVLREMTVANGVLLVLDAVLPPAPPKQVNTPHEHFKASGPNGLPDGENLLDLLVEERKFSVFASLVHEAGLDHLVAPKNAAWRPITMLVPADEYIREAGGDALLKELRGDKAKLVTFVKYHMLPGLHLSSQLESKDTVQRDSFIRGEKLDFFLEEDSNDLTVKGRFNFATVRKSDRMAWNGNLLELEGVLEAPEPLPPRLVETMQAREDLSIFRKYMIATKIWDLMGDEDATYTVFAPSDEAFNKLPANVRKRVEEKPEVMAAVVSIHVIPNELVGVASLDGHPMLVLPTLLKNKKLQFFRDAAGPTVMTNGHKGAVKVPDLKSGNGVLHVIDGVVVPATYGASLQQLIEEAETLVQ